MLSPALREQRSSSDKLLCFFDSVAVSSSFFGVRPIRTRLFIVSLSVTLYCKFGCRGAGQAISPSYCAASLSLVCNYVQLRGKCANAQCGFLQDNRLSIDITFAVEFCKETQTVTKTLDVRGSATWWDLLEGTYCFDIPDNMPEAALSPVVSNCISISAGVIEELTLTWRCKSHLT